VWRPHARPACAGASATWKAGPRTPRHRFFGPDVDLGHCGRRRRHRRPRRSGVVGALGRHLASLTVYPAKMSVEPDVEVFRQVHSRRYGHRRVPPWTAGSIPPNIVDLCFNCLASDHVKATCTFLSQCLNYRREGHQARDCS
jgi:hypothetical protein